MLSKIRPIPASLIFSMYYEAFVVSGFGRDALRRLRACQIVSRDDNLCHFGTGSQRGSNLGTASNSDLAIKNEHRISPMLLNVALRTFASRLLQDSKGLAGSGRGYRGGLSSLAFEVNDTIFAGTEVAHAGLVEHGC